ncbi:hypothetical protein ACFL3N_03230, partial [Candidatus Omnitrophota bacterium]
GYSNESLIKLPSAVRRFLRRSILYSYLAHNANLLRSYIGAKRAQKAPQDKGKGPALKVKDEAPAGASSPKLFYPEGSQWYHIYKDSHKGAFVEVVDRYILDELERLSSEHGFKVVFVIFPAFERLPSYFPEGERYVFDDCHEALRRLFEKHGFLVLDMKQYLQGRSFSDVALDDCHLSLEGHRIASRAMFDFFKENLILKR